ncbi:ion channel, partial [Candidatus Poribacteria bacterium]
MSPFYHIGGSLHKTLYRLGTLLYFLHLIILYAYLPLVVLVIIVSGLVTYYGRKCKWRDRNLLMVLKNDEHDKLRNEDYWPREDNHLRKSYLLWWMHLISSGIRLTSPLEWSKAFWERNPKNRGEVPARVIEVYTFVLFLYVILLAVYVSQKPEWFSHPFANFTLFAILAYRAIHIVHGNVYYGLLRAMYTGEHNVHNASRNVALLILAYIELCLLSATAYMVLGDQFSPPINNFGDAFYLSAIAITTLGYGGILPDCSAARILVGLETLSGLGLLALGIARFLPLVPHPVDVAHKRSDKNASGSEENDKLP